jgi:REP element-mobilizing transposase RayT
MGKILCGLDMPRRARLDAAGTLHHIILRGIEKRPIFDDDLDRETFVSRMGQLALETKTKIYAWSLLTNHAHILLRSGPEGLPQYMRRLLTGYAQAYNRRHKRYGHLFQNRYKSIVCEEDVYFQELVRYIHLNPLRAGLVQNLVQLDRYPWSGHGVLMGKVKNSWQDADHVLSWFGKKAGQARRIYHRYVSEGIKQGRRPELVGGGLIRSLGGWSAVRSLRRSGEKVLTDARILGTDDFVERMLGEADRSAKRLFSSRLRDKEVQQFIEERCKKEGISLGELQMGSRRGMISGIRSDLAWKLAKERGLPLAEIARHLGVSTSAISQILFRRSKIF